MLETPEEYDVVLLAGVSKFNTDYNIPLNDGVRRYANVDPLVDVFRPLGPYRLRTFLAQHGYNVKVIDYVPYFSIDQLDKALSKYVSTKTKVIGISTTYTVYTPEIFQQFDQLIQKHKHSSLKVVCGGPNPTTTQMDSIDIHVTGYGENALLAILQEQQSSGILDGTFDYGFPSEYSTVWKKEDQIYPTDVLSLEVGRGCIFKCAFCNFPLNGKKKNDYIRDAEELKDELVYNYEQFGLTRYNLTDDTFNDSTVKMEQLLSVFEQLPFDLRFTAFVKPELIVAYPEQIDLLVELGMESGSWGIESLSYETRKAVHKGYSYYDKLAPALTELKSKAIKKGITHYTNFYNMIVGLPGESEEDILKHHEYLIKSYECDGMDFFALSISNKETQTLPLSPIDKNPEKYGYKVKPTKNHSMMIWRNEHLSTTKAQRLAREIMVESYNHTKLSAWAGSNLWNTGFDVIDHFDNSTGKWCDIPQYKIDQAVNTIEGRVERYIECMT